MDRFAEYVDDALVPAKYTAWSYLLYSQWTLLAGIEILRLPHLHLLVSSRPLQSQRTHIADVASIHLHDLHWKLLFLQRHHV